MLVKLENVLLAMVNKITMELKVRYLPTSLSQPPLPPHCLRQYSTITTFPPHFARNGHSHHTQKVGVFFSFSF